MKAAAIGGGKRKMMAFYFLVSLAVHATLVLPVLILRPQVAETPKTEKLLIELYGMIARRQREGAAPSSAVAPVERPPPRATATRHKASASLPAPSPATVAPPGNTDLLAQPAVQATRPADAEAGSAAEARAAPSVANAADAQTTIAATDRDADALKRYLIRLRKRLEGNLAYPDDAKMIGYEGTPVLGFTIADDGTIRPGSLVIVRSSGSAELDRSALAAARASAPFDRPAHAIEVAVALAFGLQKGLP